MVEKLETRFKSARARYKFGERVVFIKENLDEDLEPMSIPCHRKLKEIFPEMDFEDLQQRLMSNLRYSVKDKVATCRYDLCR